MSQAHQQNKIEPATSHRDYIKVIVAKTQQLTWPPIKLLTKEDIK